MLPSTLSSNPHLSCRDPYLNLSTMVNFTTALLTVVAAFRVIAAPVEGPTEYAIAKRSSPNSQGTNNGFFYQFCVSRHSPLRKPVH